MKYKKLVINIIIFFSIIVLELGVATVIKYKEYYGEYNSSEYAFIESPERNYAIKIKYNSALWFAWGTSIDIYCVDLRKKPHDTVKYLGTWDRYFNADTAPEEHYKMEWSQEGVTMVVVSGEDDSPEKFEIEWDGVFGGQQ